MIEDAGFEAITASGADEAVRVLESRDDVRAVFTDVHMPGSIDGLQLARVVKERWPAVGLLLTSGKTEIAEADLPSGGRFLGKPYMGSQIKTALRELVVFRASVV
jgi:DNA-binding NtrC family response regulator